MTAPIYQLKITLKGSKPPIWRRVEVPSSISLYDLNRVIQCAMGWENEHLYDFAPAPSGPPLPYYEGSYDDFELTIRAMKRVSLDSCLIKPKQRMLYCYDFGDDWVHDVLLEKILPDDPKAQHPRCVKGKGACPPEDCGGLWGYYSMLEALADPDHEMHEHWVEWVGDEFDPDQFSLDEVNEELAEMKLGEK